jgi:hypothetical protein
LVRTHTHRTTDPNEWEIVFKGTSHFFNDLIREKNTPETKEAIDKFNNDFCEQVKVAISKL